MAELYDDHEIETLGRALLATYTTADEWANASRRDVAEGILMAAAPLIAARALQQAADDWQTGEWANVPRHADRVADRLGAAQHVCDWLRAEAARIERSRA